MRGLGTLFPVLVATVLAAACGGDNDDTEETTNKKTTFKPPAGALVAVKATAAPKLDGAADDAAWQSAPETTIHVAGGANHGETDVKLRSVYLGDTVYFSATWADPTESFLREPWQRRATDGTWVRLEDPNNRGGDENTYYEDKLAFIWSINNSIAGFPEQGCAVVCHAGENSDVKPFGNKYTNKAGETGDIWHWKSVRNLGQVDDQFLDHTRYTAATPEAGRKSDKKESGGYADNVSADGKVPLWMPPGGGDKTGAPGYILDTEKVAFDAALFNNGDLLPAIVKAPIVGDRGDIAAGWKYAGGTWTLEFSRKLTTGSANDVQFSDLKGTYYFGVAAFDHAQVRHAYQAGAATPFVFKP